MNLSLFNILKDKLLSKVESQQEVTQMLTAKQLIIDHNKLDVIDSLGQIEFKVFSQWGEDGILQYLINRLEIPNAEFVEFGVQDYAESNTRFLLQNNNWKGLVIDGSTENISIIKGREYYWKFDLTAVCHFITTENINEILEANGFTGDIGLLSVDIDGNDYWVWDAIDAISPRIVVCEYNSLFGEYDAVSIPYSPGFQRSKAHYSNLYFGASFSALSKLGEKKGYVLVGVNSNANNAFFVRDDLDLSFLSLELEGGGQQHYKCASFRESRSQNGELTYLSREQGLSLIGNLPVVDIDSGLNLLVKEMTGHTVDV